MVAWFLFWVEALKGSLIAFAVALVLGLLSMGLSGIGLYYLNWPIFRYWFPPIDQLSGDWVWPAMISVGMIWSVGFLIAGLIDHWLLNDQASALVRDVAYIFVLWFWAFILWFIVLKVQVRPGA